MVPSPTGRPSCHGEGGKGCHVWLLSRPSSYVTGMGPCSLRRPGLGRNFQPAGLIPGSWTDGITLGQTILLPTREAAAEPAHSLQLPMSGRLQAVHVHKAAQGPQTRALADAVATAAAERSMLGRWIACLTGSQSQTPPSRSRWPPKRSTSGRSLTSSCSRPC